MRDAKGGFSLIELVVVLAVAGAMVVIAMPSWSRWQLNQRVKAASQSVAKAVTVARSEAIRTGNNHIVFFQEDALGNTLNDIYGNAVPILIVDDQLPGTADQNCKIDSGETRAGVLAETGVSWGVSNATSAVATDTGDGDMATGSTFTQTGATGGSAATWVLFDSRGMAAAFKADCTISAAGSGGGAIYITNGQRDYAIVVNPLGSVQTHGWDAVSGTWSN